jgi:acetylglutamate kinase
MSGVAGALAGKLGKQGSPEDMDSVSSVHPQGAMLALLETLKKAANQLAKMDEGMAPFVNRALSILEQGVGEVISKKGAPGASPKEGGAGGAGGSAKPPQGEGNKGFPG